MPGGRAHVLLTKADKLSREAGARCSRRFACALRRDYPGTTVQLFSSLKRAGLEDAAGLMGQAVDAFRRPKNKSPG
jgi:GTP-binding protein